jgi:hypothetical protein
MADVDMSMESDYEDRISEGDSDFGSDAENRVPAKKQKATISSFAKSPVLSVNSNSANVSSKTMNGKTVEQIYQKKTQLEHILLRPDTYSKSIWQQHPSTRVDT